VEEEPTFQVDEIEAAPLKIPIECILQKLKMILKLISH